jgi:hypothetical protein
VKLLKTIGALTLVSALYGAPLAMAAEAVPAVPATAADATVSTLPAVVPVPADAASEKAKAEAKITKDQAIELAQKSVSIPDGYTLQSVNLSGSGYNQGQGPAWNLNYEKKQDNKFLGSANVRIDAVSGKLLGFNLYNSDPSYKPSYPPKADYQAAKSIADKWVEKVNPEAIAQTKYNDAGEKASKPPLRGAVQYDIRYDRIVNGIPFPQNSVSVTVNGDGDVVGYNVAWNDDLVFDDPKGTIDAETAAKKVRELGDPTLAYLTPYQAKPNTQPITVYTMDMFPIDARTGGIYVPDGMPPYEKPNLTPLTEQPLGAVPEATLNLTKEEAIAKVTSTFKLPEGMKLEDASYSENLDSGTQKPVSTWNIRWSTLDNEADAKVGQPYSNVYAAVDSKTGEILSYSVYDPTQQTGTDTDVKVKEDDAKAKAIDVVKSMLPGYTNQLVLQSTSGGKVVPLSIVKRPDGYNFTFARYIDGVRAGYDTVNVMIDSMTGDVRSYSKNFSQQPYPAQKPQTIDASKAEELLLADYDLQLQYVNDPYMSIFMAGGALSNSYAQMLKTNTLAAAGKEPVEPSKNVHLVYALVPKAADAPSHVLNAVTGGWVSPDSGEPVTLEKPVVTDIEGHWAQKDLQLMLDYQALDVKDGKANPDAAITRGELIKMLVISMNGGNVGIQYSAERAGSFADVKSDSPYFPYVERAVDLHILDSGTDGSTFNPNATLTREDMAELIVRALGYGKLAEHETIFAAPSAVGEQLTHPGADAIVVGLGIMSADGGSFLPAETVTKAQAATAFARYLQARADLQDSTPIGRIY